MPMPMPDDARTTHHAEVLAWRAEREASLRRPDGWLSLVGLHWLEAGENRLPGLPGTFMVEGDDVRYRGEGGAEAPLRADVDGEPTILRAGSLRFHLIRRGDRLGIRVRDTEARALREFSGLDYFPVDARWRLEAQFEPAAAGRMVAVPDVMGLVEETETPGTVRFDVAGRLHCLEALPGGDHGELWLIFGDASNGVDTYHGGRFLYTPPPRTGGTVIVDFNRAYSPPCVFTPYATCPLPWPANRLPIRVEAGERGFAAAAG